jgi:hypothetical protein
MAERDKRLNTNGQVVIAQISNTEAVLKNLSSSGLCIESPVYIDILPNTRYSVDIVPEKDANIEKFSLEIESRWVKAKMNASESGFVIVVPPGSTGKTFFEKYLDFLAAQSEAGTAQTGDISTGR